MDGKQETAETLQVAVVVSGVDLRISFGSGTSTQILAWRWLWRRLLEAGGPAPAASGDGASLTNTREAFVKGAVWILPQPPS
jgi:hypothetical protein